MCRRQYGSRATTQFPFRRTSAARARSRRMPGDGGLILAERAGAKPVVLPTACLAIPNRRRVLADPQRRRISAPKTEGREGWGSKRAVAVTDLTRIRTISSARTR